MEKEIINVETQGDMEKWKDRHPEENNGAFVSTSPAALMQLALNKGLDTDKLEKMLELQERWEANEARKAYTQAMADFKKDAPEIDKDRFVSYSTDKGKTEYWHASLANITRKLNAALGKYGLSAAWGQAQENQALTITCTITHCLGHSESTSLTAGPDTSGGKNNIQGIGSTNSYLERYTLLALTGLATADMDNDGQGTETEYLSDAQVSEITDLVDNSGADKVKFLEYMAVEAVDKIPATQFNRAKSALLAKSKKKEAADDSAE